MDCEVCSPAGTIGVILKLLFLARESLGFDSVGHFSDGFTLFFFLLVSCPPLKAWLYVWLIKFMALSTLLSSTAHFGKFLLRSLKPANLDSRLRITTDPSSFFRLCYYNFFFLTICHFHQLKQLNLSHILLLSSVI